MDDLNKKIEVVRAWLVLCLYATLSLFCLLLVMASIKFWPYQHQDYTSLIVFAHGFLGLLASVTGFRFCLILFRRLQEGSDRLKVDDLVFLSHLIPLSLTLFLTTILFG